MSKKQRRLRRLGISTAERQRAERPGQVWSWDFVTDQTENGSSFRILTLLDEHTRQCLAIFVSITRYRERQPMSLTLDDTPELSHLIRL